MLRGLIVGITVWTQKCWGHIWSQGPPTQLTSSDPLHFHQTTHFYVHTFSSNSIRGWVQSLIRTREMFWQHVEPVLPQDAETSNYNLMSSCYVCVSVASWSRSAMVICASTCIVFSAVVIWTKTQRAHKRAHHLQKACSWRGICCGRSSPWPLCWRPRTSRTGRGVGRDLYE